MEKRSKMVNHTSEVINNLDILLSCIKDAESSFRGFVIARDSTLLDSYEYNNQCFHSTFDVLRKLLISDPVQKHNLDTLLTSVNSKINIISLTIEEARSNQVLNLNILRNRMHQGTYFMDHIRALVFKMQTYESSMLSQRTTEFESISRTLKIVHFTTFIIALLLVIYSMVVFNSVSKAKLRYRGQLEEGIEKLKVANNDLINLRSIEKFAASGRIARAIAHEVRNPLTSISLATEQLGPSITSKDEKMLIEIITRNVDRIHHLILELLNSTKFSQLTLTKQSLNTIVGKALEMAKDRIELHGIKVIRNFSADPCMVEADGDKMTIAILNLLVNAIEAIEEGKGIIEINTSHKSDQCSFTIKDTGVGISGSSLSRIFEPYFTQKENGNGLGLTLTQNIILNHKGNISVESKEGEGTTFTILLNQAD